jgi:hypothetical protein
MNSPYRVLDPTIPTQAELDERAIRPNAKRLPEPLDLTFFDDADGVVAKDWILKNVMATGETSSWIAPPGMGKSALLTEISTHAGSGRDWRGYRSKLRCGLVYFAFERADLVRRRLAAHARRDGLSGLPIAVAGNIIDR